MSDDWARRREEQRRDQARQDQRREEQQRLDREMERRRVEQQRLNRERQEHEYWTHYDERRAAARDAEAASRRFDEQRARAARDAILHDQPRGAHSRPAAASSSHVHPPPATPAAPSSYPTTPESITLNLTSTGYQWRHPDDGSLVIEVHPTIGAGLFFTIEWDQHGRHSVKAADLTSKWGQQRGAGVTFPVEMRRGSPSIVELRWLTPNSGTVDDAGSEQSLASQLAPVVATAVASAAALALKMWRDRKPSAGPAENS